MVGDSFSGAGLGRVYREGESVATAFAAGTSRGAAAEAAAPRIVVRHPFREGKGGEP